MEGEREIHCALVCFIDAKILDSYHTWCGRVTDKDEAVRANLGKYRVDFFGGGGCGVMNSTLPVLY